MDAASEKLFDEAILTVCGEDAALRFGLAPAAIRVGVIRFGFNVSVAEIQRRIPYLTDPQVEYIRDVTLPDNFHTDLRYYRTTPKGANYLKTQAV